MARVHAGMLFTVKNTFLNFDEPAQEPALRRSCSDCALLAPRVAEALGRAALCQDALCALPRGAAPPRRPKEEPPAPPAVEASAVQVPVGPGTPPTELRTTVMLRNLPYQLTLGKLVELLELRGLGGRYDIVYVPMDFNRKQSLGYGFVNLVSPEAASMCFRSFNGLDKWPWRCSKVCQVVWSDVQGFDANVGHYRNSPVMHPDIPAPFKPTIYSGGLPVEFPPPTRELKCPRLRRGHMLVK
ncbi:unnamed protein product [Prorocentrum cordatum]|uniref:RRM domain-containing protein n=1 Tax=Prorocentrum cordatum TaxID=2364126 RepID=A0ABN9YE73_9DINO|nr:unnamed protein product [Polarella glacialis]